MVDFNWITNSGTFKEQNMWLRAKRGAAGITQRALADLLSVSVQRITNMETGKVKIPDAIGDEMRKILDKIIKEKQENNNGE